MEETNILKEQLKRATSEVRSILEEKKWVGVVRQIADKNNIIGEQLNSFENEVLFILLGMELREDFQKNIESNVGIDISQAVEIDKEIYEKLFKEIEKFLPAEITALETSNLPMVEKGEVVHSVPPVEQPRVEKSKLSVPVPNYAYEAGKDPYREPLV